MQAGTERKWNVRKESYLQKPQEVEIHAVKNGTDVILRKNIIQAIRRDEDTEETVWECEERQLRYNNSLTRDAVSENFDYYWALSEGKTDEEATDEAALKAGEPTLKERVETLEGAFMELAEVIANG